MLICNLYLFIFCKIPAQKFCNYYFAANIGSFILAPIYYCFQLF